MRHLILALALAATPALAQDADGPLGDILQSLPDDQPAAPPDAPVDEDAPFIPRVTPPPPQSVPTIVSRSSSGIVTTTLPPSTVVDVPVAPPEGATEADVFLPAPEASELAAGDDAPIASLTEPVELTPEQQQALWEAGERARLAEVDRRMAERTEAARAARDAQLADHEAALAAREADVAARDTAYKQALEETRLRAERERADWLARVEACRRGVRGACARPGE